MRILVHISDMHFGKIDTTCIDPMLAAIRAVNPHLVIISGDFTQRARSDEFQEARKFILSLEHPHLVIPGNHDIRPLYSPISRIADAYDRYKHYISDVIEPGYIDDEIAVTSVNTVRAHSIKDGRVSKRQIDRLAQWFKRVDDKKIKIVITHHPFDMPLKHPTLSKEYVYTDFRLARKAKLAVHKLAEVGVDMYLSGHYHQSSVGHTAERYKIENYSAISVRAGTISNRQRGEQQSFNLIFVEAPIIRVDTYLFNTETKKFELVKSKVFNKKGKLWVEDKKAE
jgi:3',5'-cyclic AMP phosphodiesterase CpdA